MRLLQGPIARCRHELNASSTELQTRVDGHSFMPYDLAGGNHAPRDAQYFHGIRGRGPWVRARDRLRAARTPSSTKGGFCPIRTETFQPATGTDYPPVPEAKPGPITRSIMKPVVNRRWFCRRSSSLVTLVLWTRRTSASILRIWRMVTITPKSTIGMRRVQLRSRAKRPRALLLPLR